MARVLPFSSSPPAGLRLVPGSDSSVADPAAEDATLVRQAQTGDREAFGQLARRHFAAAYSAAVAVTGEAPDAEDVTQDAFVIALDRLDDCLPAEKFRPWLLTIVRNRALDLLRRNRVRRYEPLDSDDAMGGIAAPAARNSPLGATERAELREHLEAAIATLTPVRREVLLLYDLEGWSHAEIAEHLQLAVPTVRSHLFLARRDLRARLSPELHEETGHE